MQKEERRRKFHESLLNVLYPSLPPSSHHQGTDVEEPVNRLQGWLNVDTDSDELGESGSSSSSDDEDEFGPQKLTRAQRKRLRKKKLKEFASHRRKLIGPLLPSASDEGLRDLSNEPQGVRCNVAEKSDTGSGNPGEPAACTNQNKLKHRRIAKKLAREKSMPSATTENCHQDCGTCSNNESLIRES